MQQAPLDDRYLPLKALVAYSGLGLRTLRTYLQHPTRPLPHFRIGGKIVVRQSEYDLWALGFRAQSSSRVAALVDECLKRL